MKPGLLLVEDDPAIARSVVFALEREGFTVEHVLLLQAARESLAPPNPHAALLLDWGLPDGSGADFCRELRADARLRALPVLMLTARGEEIDRVLGLESGADDYLPKPFGLRELVARVRALLRRAALAPQPTSATADTRFEHDAAGQRIRYAGHWLTLTRLEYGLLATLLAAPSRIHGREALLAAVWGDATEAGDRTVDTHVKTLRAKLRGVTPGVDPIVTHRGLGWGLAPE